MSDRTMNLIIAAACALISLCCFAIKIIGGSDSMFPYVGGGLCAFLALAYLKHAFID